MTTLALLVNGFRYEGWRSVNVTRTIQSAAGSFELEISERWSGQSESWPIREEDTCRVELAGQVVITGFVDTRSQSISPSARTFAVSGKDAAGTLVECSALLTRWSFRKADALQIARTVAAEYGIDVKLQPGIGALAKARKLVVNPGDSAWDVIQRAAQADGLLAISDGQGAIELARAGADLTSPIVEGENLLSASVDYNASERYRSYVAMTQAAGDDNNSGNAVRVRATATDEAVLRTSRTLVVRPQRGMPRSEARKYVDWLARTSAAKAETVRATVRGWTQDDGSLWPVNQLCPITAPSLGVDGEMLISEVRHSLSPGGELTELALVRPDAFAPDPSARVELRGGKWKVDE